MADESRADDELGELERELASLTPREPSINQARLMFEAGRASMRAELTSRRGTWFWPSAAGTMAVAASLFALLWASSRGTQEIVRTIYLPAESQSAAGDDGEEQSESTGQSSLAAADSANESQRSQADESPRSSANGRFDSFAWPRQTYLEMREVALAHGLDAMREPSLYGSAEVHESVTYRQLRRAILSGEGG